MSGIAISGYGTALPPIRVSNADLARQLDTTDEWIVERTGIRERRVARAGETTASLAIDAGARALRCADVSAEEIDLCIVATTSPEQPVPATAAFVQDKLGLRCGAFDVAAACAGFVYGLITAASFLATSSSTRHVLLIGSETLTRCVDPRDRNTAILFGDGAAAVVVSKSDHGALLAFDFGCDGSAIPFLGIAAGGSRSPATHASVEGGQHWLIMEGREVFRRAVRAVTASVETTLVRGGVSAADVDLVVPHQANVRIIDALLTRLDIPSERVVVNIDRYGNTSAASVPLALSEAIEGGRTSNGDLVLFTGFGAGMTWATALVRWGAPLERPVART